MSQKKIESHNGSIYNIPIWLLRFWCGCAIAEPGITKQVNSLKGQIVFDNRS